MEEIYICSADFYRKNKDRLISVGITHIITDIDLIKSHELIRFHYFLVELKEKYNSYTPLRLAPKVMDYLREIFLFRGKVLIIEEDNISQNSRKFKKKFIYKLISFRKNFVEKYIIILFNLLF